MMLKNVTFVSNQAYVIFAYWFHCYFNLVVNPLGVELQRKNECKDVASPKLEVSLTPELYCFVRKN